MPCSISAGSRGIRWSYSNTVRDKRAQSTGLPAQANAVQDASLGRPKSRISSLVARLRGETSNKDATLHYIFGNLRSTGED